MPLSVGIYIFDNVEVLDFAGPYEVFTTASRVHRRSHPDAEEPFRVCTVARSAALVRARAGLRIVPDHDFASHPPLDILIVPGGDVSAELQRSELAPWLRRCFQRSSITASVCTGSFLLARAGLLGGLRATTHWEDLDDMRLAFPSVSVVADVPWVDEGRVITSAGISAGIGMSLHVVARIAGGDLAHRTARQMEL